MTKQLNRKKTFFWSKVVTAAIRHELNCAGSLSSGEPSEEETRQQVQHQLPLCSSPRIKEKSPGHGGEWEKLAGTQENQVLSWAHGLWIIEAAHKESQQVRQHCSQSQCSSRKSVLYAWIQPISFTGESRPGSEGGIFKVPVQK